MYEIICKLLILKSKLGNFNKNFQLELSDLKKNITNFSKIFLVNPNLPIEYEFNEKVKSQIFQICKKKISFLFMMRLTLDLVLNQKYIIQLIKNLFL